MPRWGRPHERAWPLQSAHTGARQRGGCLMSDLLILSIIGIGTLWALREPWIGALTWAWVSLMSPHVQFGWRAAEWPVATAVAGTT
ncbi:MAG: hypothetical protein ACRDL7_16060, partial [Gaiellaceae bacterium]